jgi:hypothetical protein
VGGVSKSHPRYSRPAQDADNDRETDPGLWLELHSRFHFTIDAAAGPLNCKLPRFWTRDDDALTRSWQGERVWCNPPFADPAPWVTKAQQEAATGECPLIVMLLPNNRTEQRWWQQLVEPHRDRGNGLRTEFLPGRPRFKSPTGWLGRPPFGLVLLIWESRHA